MIVVSEKEKKLQSIIELENKLNEIQDVDVLLERILTETRRIVNADAGSIYVVSGENGTNLSIKYSQNDTQLRELPSGEKLPYLFFSFPINEKSIAGYVASTGKSLRIADAYDLPAELPFKFNKQTDLTTNYRTKSMYTIPLKMASGQLLGVLQIINAQDEAGNVIPFDDDAELYISHFATAAVQALQHAYNTQNMVRRMLKMSEFRDPKETYPHVERVSNISLEIYDRWAFNNNVPEEERHKFRDNLKIAAKFHDIGKVGVSDIILKKQFPRFTDDERNIMKGHTCLGAMLFYPPESSLDEMAADVALHHHERWDGNESGYPGKFDLDKLVTYSNENDAGAGQENTKFQIGGAVVVKRPLKGNEIPLAARIVAVADVFDALSHRRCYKDAWSVDEAFNMIQSEAGKQFDPEIVLAFMKIRERVISILTHIPDDEEV
ncbi:MAG: HD domain-containing protein [Treponema porcinum]|nr:HD domain-containing protein [Treponema porcinum]